MAWGSVSGVRWAGPARARTTARSSPPIFRGPMLNALTEAVSRSAGRSACLVAILLTVGRPDRLSAQGFLSQFSSDNLKPSALQLDLGPVGGNNILRTLTGGLRLDYGFIAPHVRVLLGVWYYKPDVSVAARARFEQRVKRVLIDPSADDTIRLGRITWS